MLLNNHDQRLNIGHMLIRVGLAAALLFYSVPRLFAGAGHWRLAAKTIDFLDTGLPLKWIGLLLLAVEFAGAVSLITGYLFRTAGFLLTLVMGLYCFAYFQAGHVMLPLFAFSLTFVLLGLVFTGPGGYVVSFRVKH